MATGKSRQSIDVSVKEPLGDINKMYASFLLILYNYCKA